MLSLLPVGAAMAQEQPATDQANGVSIASETPAPHETSAQTQPTTAPAPDNIGNPFVLLLPLAVGTVLLGIWIVRSVKSPEPLRLRNAPRRPNRLSPLLVLGPFVAYSLLGLPAVLPAVRADVHLQLLATLFAQGGWAAAALLLAAWAFDRGLRDGGFGLGLRHAVTDAAQAGMALLTVLPVVMGTLLASHLLVDWAVQQGLMPLESVRPNIMLERLHSVGLLGKGLIIVSAVVLAPLAEELFFRGLLQSMLRNYLSPWGAILVASLLFALVHLAAIRDVIPLLPLAIVLGYTYERHGRLTIPIFLHALFNALMLAAALAQ